MNTTRLLAALAISLAASGAAWAQEATVNPTPQADTSLTRAQVAADTLAARTDGTLARIDARVPTWTGISSNTSRASVHAETLRAMASGEIQMLDNEAYRFTTQRAAIVVGE